MKRIIFFLLLLCHISASAQWSVGIDARISPFDQYREHYIGTDVVLNYSHNFLNNFYLMPALGLFYKNYYSKIMIDGGPRQDAYYQSGFDFAIFAGKRFKVRNGNFLIFTGPRYAFAFASKDRNINLNRNSFDWRFGVGYSRNRITFSLKVDIGCLKVANPPHWDVTQLPTIAVGFAYNL